MIGRLDRFKAKDLYLSASTPAILSADIAVEFFFAEYTFTAPAPVEISYVGSASAASNSVTLPAHQAGDLIYIYATRDGSNTWPTIPSGWLPIAAAGANSISSRQGFRIARGSSETSGTWTDATHIVAVVMRNALGIGNGTGNSGTSSTLNWPAWTLADATGPSWINAFAAHRTANNVSAGPALLTNRTSVGTGPQVAAFDSNGVVSSSWLSSNQSVSASSGWLTSIGEYLIYSDWTNYADSTFVRSNDAKTITSGVASAQSAWTSYPRNDKRVFAITFTQTGGSTGPTIGLGDSTAGGETTYRSGYQGELGSCGLNPNGDFYINNTGPTATGITYATGSTVLVALDAVAELIWYGKRNGSVVTWSGDPDAGTGGISIAALASGYSWPGVSSDQIGDKFAFEGSPSDYGLTTFLAWDDANILSGFGVGADADDTSSASGTVSSSGVTGSGAVTDADDAGSATGAVRISGSGAVTDASDTGSATGAVRIDGTASATDAADTSAASGTVSAGAISGSGAVTDADDTSSASGSVRISGTAAANDDNDTSTASGVVRIDGTASATDENDTGYGEQPALPITGTAAANDDDDTGEGFGFVALAPGTYALAIEGGGTVTLQSLEGGGFVIGDAISFSGRVVAGSLRGRP